MSLSEQVASIEREYERRMVICRACSNLKHIIGLDQCGRCGCMLAAKARLPNAMCPDDKWELVFMHVAEGLVGRNGVPTTHSPKQVAEFAQTSDAFSTIVRKQ